MEPWNTKIEDKELSKTLAIWFDVKKEEIWKAALYETEERLAKEKAEAEKMA